VLDAHLTCSAGECKCEDGFSTCGGATCSIDLKTDGRHCGDCENDCIAGACNDGLCREGQLVVESYELAELAAFGDTLIYTRKDGGPVVSVPIRGGTPQPLSNSGNALSLLLFDGMIYSTNGSDVWAMRADDTERSVVIAPGVNPVENRLAAGGNWLYWVAEGSDATQTGQLKRKALDGSGSVESFETFEYDSANPDRPNLFVADATHVYWAEPNKLLRAPHGKQIAFPVFPPEKLVDLQRDAQRLAVDGTSVYWLDRSGVHRFDIRAERETQLATGAISIVRPGLAISAEHVYFTAFESSRGGIIRRVPKDGGEPEDFVQGQFFGINAPIAVDETALYWVSGTVLWMRKL
jgi:hypothetical protein